VIVPNKKYVGVGLGVGLLSVVATWIITATPLAWSGNPFAVVLFAIWAFLHAHIYFLVEALLPSFVYSAAAWFLIFFQWFFVGYLLAWLLGRIKKKWG
jgi:hypothetical protein